MKLLARRHRARGLYVISGSRGRTTRARQEAEAVDLVRRVFGSGTIDVTALEEGATRWPLGA
jgi:hypothetical protein